MKIKTQRTILKQKRNKIQQRPFVSRDIARGYVQMAEYERPVTLKKALYDIRRNPEINQGIASCKEIIQRFIDDLGFSGNILKRKVVKMLASGASAIVFETADGKVIKITDGNHIPFNRPLQDFDVPVFQKGKSGKTYFYIEEKLFQNNLPDFFVDIIKEMIKSAGFVPVDLYDTDVHQIGISAKNHKLYLLDAECARYKNILHAIFDKIFRLSRRK